MESEARTLMKELRQDHRNMSIVLDVLEDVVREASSGHDPDFELVDEIMRYMTVYPDAVHHPKENIIYENSVGRQTSILDHLQRQGAMYMNCKVKISMIMVNSTKGQQMACLLVH